MRILFVHNALAQCGGITNNLQIAKGLADMGHEVYVRYPYSNVATTSYRKLKRSLATSLRSVGLLNEKEIHWMDCPDLDLRIVPSLKEKYLPDADATIFSWWKNAYDVREYSSRQGEKFYYAQHFEPLWAGDPKCVDATYRMGFHILANSAWVEKQIKRLGVPVEGIVYPGVSGKFYPLPPGAENPLKGSPDFNYPIIGAPYREWNDWKGYQDVLRAIDIVRKDHPYLILRTYGLKSPPPEDISIFFEGMTDEYLNMWYNSLHVFVNASHYEGYGSPAVEAMRCKVPTCSTQVGVLDDFHKYCGASLSPPRDPKALADNILLVLDCSAMQIALKIGEAYDFACQFTWDKAAKSMATALEDWVKK